MQFLRTVIAVTCSGFLVCSLTAAIRADVVIRDAKVFTGDEILDSATVVFRGSEIAIVSTSGELPSAVSAETIIDAKGMTLLPGLIDAHTHNFANALETSLNFGVTTVIDMFSDPNLARMWRSEQEAGLVWDRADFFGAGVLVTVAGGHGTQFGVPIPTLDDPANIESFIQDRVEEGSDFIKIVYEHGFDENNPLPTHDASSLSRIVKAAHSFNKLAVFHISTAAEAVDALNAGADALVHVYHGNSDEESMEVVRRAVEKEAFVIPTLSVIESFYGTGGGRQLAEDPRISPYLDPIQSRFLTSGFGNQSDGGGFDRVLKNVSQLHQEGVPILAGTDAANPGTAWGASMHREMELLAAAGLSNHEVLHAATAAPAEHFGLADRGRIREGYRADAVLVHGDPFADITATRDIHSIFKNGREFERRVGQADSELSNQSTETKLEISGDFDGTEVAELSTLGWVPSADSDFGGASSVTLELAERDHGRSLRIHGEIKAGYAYPWSGAMVNLGPVPMQAVDASDFSTLAFVAKGEGKKYRVLAFAESLGFIPATVEFQADAEWRTVEIPLSRFSGLQSEGLIAFLFSGPSAHGEFWLEIDDVSLNE